MSRLGSFNDRGLHLWWNRRQLYVDAKFVARNITAAFRLPRFERTERAGFIFRGAGRADGSEISDLYTRLNAGAHLQARLSWLVRFAGGRVCLAAHTPSSGVVAFVLFYFNERDIAEGTIHEGFIGVAAPFRGRGVASALRQKAIEHFRAAGMAGISSRISLSNTASMNSAVRLGFTVADRYYDPHMCEDRAYLKLMLSEFPPSADQREPPSGRKFAAFNRWTTRPIR